MPGWYGQRTKYHATSINSYAPSTIYSGSYSYAPPEKIKAGRQLNKGQPTRLNRLLKIKLKVIDKYDELKNEPDWRRPTNLKKAVAKIMGTSPSNVQRWWKERDNHRALFKARHAHTSFDRGSMTLKVMRRLPRKRKGKFDEAEHRLYQEFREKRKKGFKVNGLWLRLKFRSLVEQLHGVNVKTSKSWLFSWSGRFKCRARKRTAYKIPVADRLPKIRRWHQRFITRLSRGKQVCSTYGRWRLENRFNSDQVALLQSVSALSSAPLPPPLPMSNIVNIGRGVICRCQHNNVPCT
jgi:hypothetical protein